MTIRNALLGLTAACSLAVWAWCRPGANQAQAQGAEVIRVVEEPGDCTTAGGNHEEAATRFRTNQSHHWKQVALGSGTN